MAGSFEMNKIFARNTLLWGEQAQFTLLEKHVIVFGLGGVGGHAAEALARAGIGNITIIDFDKVDITNFNRQIIATLPDLNLSKTDVLEKRLLSINPNVNIFKHQLFYESAYNELVFNQHVDFIIDAIDSVYIKVDLIEYALKNNIQIISSMGTGNRLDPTKVEIRDIADIKGLCCPFARKVRTLLKKKNIEKGLKVVISTEPAIKPEYPQDDTDTLQGRPPGSSPFVPPVAGITLASYVVKDLLKL